MFVSIILSDNVKVSLIAVSRLVIDVDTDVSVEVDIKVDNVVNVE